MYNQKNLNILNALGMHIHGGMSILDIFLKIKFNKYLVDKRIDNKKFKKKKRCSFYKSFFIF